jgi:hypothetical protein
MMHPRKEQQDQHQMKDGGDGRHPADRAAPPASNDPVHRRTDEGARCHRGARPSRMVFGLNAMAVAFLFGGPGPKSSVQAPLAPD